MGDSMFDGLGLGNYVNQDKSKLVSKMIGDNNNHSSVGSRMNMPKSSSSQNLSLQEKQRILAEQETAQIRSSKSPTPSKPLDLTDSLINKSMSMNQISTNLSSWNDCNKSSNWNNSSMNPSGFSQVRMPQIGLNTSSPGFGNFSQSVNLSSMSSNQVTKLTCQHLTV